MSDRIARAFNRPGATRALALDICKAFEGLLQKLMSYGSSGKIFHLISAFLSNRERQVVLNGMSSLKYPVRVHSWPYTIPTIH